MNYQWYPGHMTKARRMMQENMQWIDLVIELVDARIPLSSRNPDIDTLAKGKARIILLNKADLADEAVNRAWTDYYRQKGLHVLEVNSRTGQGVKSINALVQQACREKIERNKKRGIVNRPMRAIVVGIPNVGKSTFINSYAGKACAKTGNKPGVTKGKQWIRLNKDLELLDTPGILWPKFEDQQTGMMLAFIGSMNDEILILEELAVDFIRSVEGRYGSLIQERYGLETLGEPAQVLEEIARRKYLVKKGEEPDYTRAASLLIEDFRGGRLGRMTLERPGEDCNEGS